ncbi:peptidoglycan-binding domain-containing protein, partial [Roseateles sp. GG27B]
MMDRVWFSKGLRGLSATRIQQYLVALGQAVGSPASFVDGDFGAMTETALGNLQAAHGLPR